MFVSFPSSVGIVPERELGRPSRNLLNNSLWYYDKILIFSSYRDFNLIKDPS